MFLAGGGDLGRKPGRGGIIPPHQPLQLGKLAHHLALQIGLGHPRRLGRKVGRGPHQRRDLACQRRDPRHPVGLAPEPVVKGHRRKPRAHPLHAPLADRAQVVLPEEPRIRQPRRQHLAIAGKDRRTLVGRLDIGHGDEPLDPPRARIADREELLMLPHRGLQHLGRQSQELRPDGPHQHHRPFHQPRHLGQKPRILDQLQPLRKGQRLRIGPDMRGPLLGAQHHMGALEPGLVIVERGHRKAARRHEPVPARHIARPQALDLDRHDLRPRLCHHQAQDRRERPHPAQRPLPPAHRLRPGKLAHHAVKHLGHDHARRPARRLDHGEPRHPLLVGPLLQPLERHPRRPQEPLHCRLGRAHRRAAALLAHRPALARKARHREREPARRDKGRSPRIGQPRLHQPLGHQPAQVIGGARLHPRRDLLGQKLDQQISHHSASPGSGGQPSGGASPSKTTSPQALIWCQTKPRPSGSTATTLSMP